MKKKIAIAIAAMAVVLIGVILWQIQKTSDNSTGKSQTSTTADHSEGGKYLVVKEWDVRFKLPDKLKNKVIYGLKNSVTGEFDIIKPEGVKGQIASFEISDLSNLPNNKCTLFDESDGSGKGGGMGAALSRVESSKIDQSENYTGIKIYSDAKYTYLRFGAKGSCVAPEYRSKEAAFQQSLYKSFESLKEVNQN